MLPRADYTVREQGALWRSAGEGNLLRPHGLSRRRGK